MKTAEILDEYFKAREAGASIKTAADYALYVEACIDRDHYRAALVKIANASSHTPASALIYIAHNALDED